MEVTKSRRIVSMGHEARMEDVRDASIFLSKHLKGRGLLVHLNADRRMLLKQILRN
jgi:hypothetical protein